MVSGLRFRAKGFRVLGSRVVGFRLRFLVKAARKLYTPKPKAPSTC